MFHIGECKSRNGVGIVVSGTIKKKIVEVLRSTDRIIRTKVI